MTSSATKVTSTKSRSPKTPTMPSVRDRKNRDGTSKAESTSPARAEGDSQTDPAPAAVSRSSSDRPTEEMPAPWRLGVIGLGIAIPLAARLFAVNGYASIDGPNFLGAYAIGLTLVGLGLLATATTRDRFSRLSAIAAVTTAVSYGAYSWATPSAPSGVQRWESPTRLLLAFGGFGLGLTIAGLIAVVLVRRAPTSSVALLVFGATLVVAACTVLMSHMWPAIAAMAIAGSFTLWARDR